MKHLRLNIIKTIYNSNHINYHPLDNCNDNCIFEYVRYCMECDAGYQEYSYVNAVINIVGDRYLILLVSGILIVWSIAGLLAVTRNNFYLKLLITIFISRHTILQILAAHPVFINLLNKMVTQPSSQ